MHVNIRSLPKHWDQLHVYLSKMLNNIDVVVLTETNIDAQNSLSLRIGEFNSFSVCRVGRGVGGILAFVTGFLDSRKDRFFFSKCRGGDVQLNQSTDLICRTRP